MLARSGVPVTLAGRALHMEAIAREGLQIDGIRVHERISVRATAGLEEGVRDADVILFCVKTVSLFEQVWPDTLRKSLQVRHIFA